MSVLIVGATNDRHISYLQPRLEAAAVPFFWFDPGQPPSTWTFQIDFKDNQPSFVIRCSDGRVLDSAAVGSVWYRKPTVPTLQFAEIYMQQFAEREWTHALDWLWLCLNQALWINRPEQNRQAANRVLQWTLAASLGFTVPTTVVTNDPDVLRNLGKDSSAVIMKVLNQTVVETGRGQMSMYARLLDDKIMTMAEALRVCPNIFQAYVEKRVEWRVTVVGDKVFACRIFSQQSERASVDWRRYDLANTPHEAATLPLKTEDRCRELVKMLGLKFGAIDLIETPSGELVFLEINPNGQWLWIEVLTGLSIAEALVEALR